MTTTFIDTSVLCNLLPVPGRNQNQAEVQREQVAREKRGERLILPVTAVIETGNFVAQLSQGGQRRATAELLVKLIQLVVAGRAPWTLHRFSWDGAFLELLISGGGTGSTLIEHATNRVGVGDLCIMSEKTTYERRSGLSTTIWTLDEALGAHA